MKDVHSVLHQKEQDVERVRKEIQSLLRVIPLLADDQPSLDIMRRQLSLGSSRTVVERPEDGMTQLEGYFPFIKHLRKSKHL